MEVVNVKEMKLATIIVAGETLEFHSFEALVFCI